MTDVAARPTVILGLGNPLMGDDGTGLAALDAVEAAWTLDDRVELVDGGTWGMTLLPVIERAHRLLILDAIDRGARPGEVLALEGAEIPRFLATKVSPHQIDLREVLALAELRGTVPDPLVAIGIQPARVTMSTELSPEVRCQLPVLLDRVRQQLAQWGIAAPPKVTPAYA